MSFFKELKRRNVFRVGIAYTVATWLLIQVTDTIFPRIGLPDSAVTLVIALLSLGFIPALIFAWAYEMTPDGLKREKDVDRTQSMTPQTGKTLDRVIIAGLALVILGMSIERIWFAGQDQAADGSADGPGAISAETQGPGAAHSAGKLNPAPADATVNAPVNDNADDRQSVAVLPFTAMSSGEDDGYFADGLTEEILNSLARLPELLVTARTSSFHFKDKNIPVPEIAATLGVEHVVEGSVRRSGERVRITAQLIRAEDGFHLWSQTYDRTLEDVFAVQEDIAENIAETLNVVLNEDKRRQMSAARIKDVQAFIAYQKGIDMMARAHATGDPVDLLPEANRYFDQALAIVPTITNAQMERTDLFGHIIYNHAIGRGNFTTEQAEAAMEEILTGLAQAARSAPSEAQRAYIEAERAEFSSDWSVIPARLDRAFQSDECYAVNWVASVAGVFGWAKQIAAHFENLMRCDPMSGLYVAMAGQFLIWAGQPERVIELSSQYLDKVAFNPWVEDMRFMALLASGKYRDAAGVYDPNPEGSYFKVPRKLYTYAMENDIARAREIFETAKKEAPVDDMTLLITEASLGNREAANAYASEMDARFAGPFILAEAVKGCFCGAPFDLEATPNFKKRIEEAGFHWPPPSPIKYPAKDW